jgi:flagellar biogenesis protein FliO
MLHLIEVGPKKILISSTTDSIRLLTELPSTENLSPLKQSGRYEVFSLFFLACCAADGGSSGSVPFG